MTNNNSMILHKAQFVALINIIYLFWITLPPKNSCEFFKGFIVSLFRKYRIIKFNVKITMPFRLGYNNMKMDLRTKIRGPIDIIFTCVIKAWGNVFVAHHVSIWSFQKILAFIVFLELAGHVEIMSLVLFEVALVSILFYRLKCFLELKNPFIISIFPSDCIPGNHTLCYLFILAFITFLK